jgi:hypothetical protein
LLFAALFLAGCQEEAPQEEFIRPVKALKVADADTFEGVKYNGIAQATQQVDLSFRVDGPGGYKFTDFVKIGVPLSVIVGIITIILAPFVWPF